MARARKRNSKKGQLNSDLQDGWTGGNITRIVRAERYMESDMSDIGQIALEALRDIDGKVIVETMSPEFVSFLGDVYRSLKFDK